MDPMSNEWTWFLAQDEGLPLAGEDAAEVAPGGAANGATPPGGRPADPFGGGMFVLLIVVFGVFIVWSMLAQRRERRKRESMLSAMKKHDRVQTIGGIVGSIVDIDKETVTLKVDESSNTRITFARSAIQQVLTDRSSQD